MLTRPQGQDQGQGHSPKAKATPQCSGSVVNAVSGRGAEDLTRQRHKSCAISGTQQLLSRHCVLCYVKPWVADLVQVVSSDRLLRDQ